MSGPLLRVMSALTLVAALTFPGAVRASSWQTVGLGGFANVDALVMAPSLPARLYVTPYRAGVFRSDDRGESWGAAREGLPMDVQIWALAVSPTNPDRVLAGLHGTTPLYRSEDGGGSWTPSSTGLVGDDVVAFAFSPSDPSRVLAGGPSWGIYRSNDAGLTWTPGTGFPTTTLYCLGVHPTDPQIALAATYSGLYRTSDGGATWSLALAGNEFRSVSWSPAAPGRAYASQYASVYRSTDSGVTWTSSLAGTAASIAAVRAHPTIPSLVFAGGSQSQCAGFNYWPTKSLVARSTDGGVTWTTTRLDVCMIDSSVHSLDVDGEHVVIGLQSCQYFPVYPRFADGVWRSDDGGLGGWSLKTAGITATPVAAVASDLYGGLWARCNGLFHATETGGPWESRVPPVVNGTPGIQAVDDFEVNLANPDRIQEAGLWFDQDYGGTYTQCSLDGARSESAWFYYGYVGTPGRRIVSNHGDGSRVYVFDGSARVVYRSTDGGRHFSAAGTGVGLARGCIDPADPDRVFALDTTQRVRLSTDGGATWAFRSSGLPAGPAVDLRMDRASGDHLLAVYQTAGIFETTDGGITWSVLPIDLGGAQVKAADWDAAGERVFLLTTTGRVYVTGLGFVEGDLPTRSLTSLSYSAVHDVLLVGSAWMGAFALDLSATGAPAITRRPCSSLELSVAPNPTSSFASIRFAVPAKAAGARLDVYDAAGRLVRRLRAALAPGDGVISWGGRDSGASGVAPGVYFVRLSSGREQVVQRVVLLR
ncbi:MAG: FlgD immunoglobulin-like domain containing protein [bacterium]